MLKSLVNKVAGVKHRFFPVKLANFLRTSFLKSASGGCFCTYCPRMASHAVLVGGVSDRVVSIKWILGQLVYTTYKSNRPSFRLW